MHHDIHHAFPWIAGALACIAAAPAARTGQEPAIRWTQAQLQETSLKIQADVGRLRGEPFERPVEVRLASQDQFVDYARAHTERSQPGAQREADETISKMLGLIPHDMDLLGESLRLLRDQVGGFYDPATDVFYLMDNCPVGLANIVLAHELGHALDDSLYDIGGTMGELSTVTDRALAYHAVVEGSGMAVMNRWIATNSGSIDLRGMAQMQREQTESMARAPMVLWKPLLGSYLIGAAFLARTDSLLQGQTETANNADLDAGFRSPPLSTEQVLHPEKYWDPAKRDDPTVVAQEFVALPKGWDELRRDTLGEIVIGIWTQSAATRAGAAARTLANPLAIEFTNSAASGWDGDELLLLGDADGARVLRWVSVWDSEVDAAEFLGAASTIAEECRMALTLLAGGKGDHVGVRYGGAREVIVELAYGVKGLELKKILRAFD